MAKKHDEVRFMDFDRDCGKNKGKHGGIFGGGGGGGGGGQTESGGGQSGGGQSGGGQSGGGQSGGGQSEGFQSGGGGGEYGGKAKTEGGGGTWRDDDGGGGGGGGGFFGKGKASPESSESSGSSGWRNWLPGGGGKGGGGGGFFTGGQERIIMAPPLYADLGKDARNVFGKGYHFGLIKLDCKTRTASGVEFSTGGVSNQESGKVFGSLETKYCVKEYGLTFSEKWNTDNTLGTEVSVCDSIAKGLKLGLDTTFAPHTGEKSGVVKSEFKNDICALNAEVDLDLSGPKVSAAAVLGYNGWLAGYQTAYDKQRSKIVKNNLALGYAAGDFILHTNVDNGQEFGGSIFHKVNSWLQTAIQISWSFDNNETKFGLGCKYDIDRDSALRAKVNNASQIGIGYSQRLRDGITVMLSALIDGKNFNQGGHKIGVALELEA